MNALITPSMMRKELCWLLGTMNQRDVYFSIQVTDDGTEMNELTAAFRGTIRSVRFTEMDRMMRIDDFSQRFIEPLAFALWPIHDDLGVWAQFAA
jgi:hypothetical protein